MVQKLKTMERLAKRARTLAIIGLFAQAASLAFGIQSNMRPTNLSGHLTRAEQVADTRLTADQDSGNTLQANADAWQPHCDSNQCVEERQETIKKISDAGSAISDALQNRDANQKNGQNSGNNPGPKTELIAREVGIRQRRQVVVEAARQRLA